MSSALHPLVERYQDLAVAVPEELRARKGLEDELAAHLTGGHHVCIRGFARSGKSTLMNGALVRACERSGGAAFVLDFGEADGGQPMSSEGLLARVAAKVNEFLARVGATELKADAAAPLNVLGELAAPLFVGFDSFVALGSLGVAVLEGLVTALLSTPRNVKVVLVCGRQRELDAFVEANIVAHPRVATAVVPPIADDELVQLVQTPAQAEGVTFENEALGALAEISGNRPWEVLTLCALLASRLPPAFQGSVGPEKVDELVNLDVLGESAQGQELIATLLRILVTAMSPEERTVMELLSAGKEGEATEDALQRLQESGWIAQQDDGYGINGALIEFVSRAIVEDHIRVTTE